MFLGRFYIDMYLLRRALLGFAAVLLGAAGLAYVLTGEGPAAAVGSDGTADCRAYAVDVGTSTGRGGDTSVRQEYLEHMTARLQEAADDGARVYIGYFAGDPPQSLEPIRFDDVSDNDFTADGQRAERRATAQRELTRQLTKPRTRNDGSAVLATIGALERRTPAGCDIELVSDGIEHSELGEFHVGGRTPFRMRNVETIVARVRRRDAIPDLSDRAFSMPFLNVTAGTKPSDEYSPQARRDATERFWERFAEEAGTSLGRG